MVSVKKSLERSSAALLLADPFQHRNGRLLRADPLVAKADGTIMSGNTRVFVLRERGYDVDALPRTPYEELSRDVTPPEGA